MEFVNGKPVISDEELANYVYTYDLEEIDDNVKKWTQGITPALMDEAMYKDMMFRIAELERGEADDDEFVETRSQAMQRKLEKQRRKATTTDVLIIELTDEQKKQIHDDMSVSYVRNNHKLKYHMRDDRLFDSVERKEIHSKLIKLQKNYYSMNEWIEAMKVIMEAIEFSLDHDYPWLTHEQAVDSWNKGKIKFTFCPIPQLWTSWTTSVTDPETLKGVLRGEVTVHTANDKVVSQKKKQRHTTEPVGIHYDYGIVSDAEFEMMKAYHQRGYDTPISTVIKAARGTFNRFSLPENNYFYNMESNGTNPNIPITFDWSKEGAGLEYFRIVNGIKQTTDDLIDFLSEQNDHKLGPVMRTALEPFLKSVGKSDMENMMDTTGYSLVTYNGLTGELERASEKEIELEKKIMDQMMIVS